MQRLRFIVFRNAIANVVRGVSSAVVALALPHFLVHSLGRDRFSAWSLILQIAAYAGFLDFGLQLAISRFLAQAIELDDRERQRHLISVALSLLIAAGIFAFLVFGFVVLMMPKFFSGVPFPILSEVRFACFILGASAAALLPGSLYTGILIGLHRNDAPAIVIASTRLMGALAVIATVHFTQSLVVLAACVAVPNLLGGFLQWVLAGRLLPGSNRWWMWPDRAITRELVQYCTSLMVFSFSMFLVSGLDVTILGHFDFKTVGFYSIASLLVTFISGINNSILAALMTPLAALQARHEIDRIRSIVLISTRASLSFNLLGTGVLFCFGPALLRLWVGEPYATLAYPIMQILMLAQLVRLIPSAYCTMLIATGQQKNAIGNSLAEGFVNLATSIAGVIYFGVTGVAMGTLIGAVAAVAWVAMWTVKMDRVITISSRERAVCVILPFACSLPVFLTWLATRRLPVTQVNAVSVAQIFSLLVCGVLMIVFADILPRQLKHKLRLLKA